jgi:hypothetical protein
VESQTRQAIEFAGRAAETADIYLLAIESSGRLAAGTFKDFHLYFFLPGEFLDRRQKKWIELLIHVDDEIGIGVVLGVLDGLVGPLGIGDVDYRGIAEGGPAQFLVSRGRRGKE